MGDYIDCFFQNRSKAPAQCRQAADEAVRCMNEVEGADKCMSEHGEETMTACKDDVMKFCGREYREEGVQATYQCMMRNNQVVSPQCMAASQGIRNCVQCKEAQFTTFDLCIETFSQVCNAAKDGEEEECFMRNRSAFPASCQSAVSSMQNTCGAGADDKELTERIENERTREAQSPAVPDCVSRPINKLLHLAQ